MEPLSFIDRGPWHTIHTLRDTRDGQERLKNVGWKPAITERRSMKKGTHKTVGRGGPFMGWDGEGVTVGGRHRYVMLCNDFGLVLSDPTGIPTERLLFE